jgi:two-component system NtrC family sensor kinase
VWPDEGYWERDVVKKLNYLEKLPLNLAIVGGGGACKFFLDLLQMDSLTSLHINIVGVCDIDPEAEGFRLARELGIHTTNDFRDLFKIKDLDGVIELTGDREVLLELIRLRPRGLGVVEHNISRLLRSLFIVNKGLRLAEQRVSIEKGISDFLIQQTNERIVILNPDFRIVEANESYLEAVGKSKEEVIGDHCYKITHGLTSPCSSTQPELGCPLLETLKTGKSAHVIHEHPTPDGQPFYCDMVTYPLIDQTGEIVRVIEIWRDITDTLSSKLERRVNEMKADLKKVIQEDRMISLGKLVASSVHEINNPIQGLLTFSDLMRNILEEGEPGPQDLENFKKYLSLMSSELERCGAIISGLLSFARQFETEYMGVDLNEILEQVTNLTRHRMEIQNVRLTLELPPRPMIINGNLNQLQQCFLNLIFNALEAMPKGGELIVRSYPGKAPKRARVEIRDTGCGIAEEDLGHIFDPFFTAKEEGEGTGMGLSIVYGILKNHEGEVQVDSQVGKGTSFVLSFPIQ